MQPSSRAARITRRNPESQDYGRKHRPDYVLLLLTLVLLAIGVIVVYSISSALGAVKNVSGTYFVNRQLIAIGLSFGAFIVASQFPIAKLRIIAQPLLIAAGLMTLIAILLPTNPDYPAHRWVRLGAFSFQSVELLKFAVLIWLAGFLTDRVRSGAMGSFHQTLKPIAIVVAVIGLVVTFVQKDLGSTGVMVAMIGAMAFVAGLPLKRVLMIGGIIAIGTLLAVASTPYRRDRLATFLSPEADCQNAGYQACQALIAVGSGGIIGQGLGSDVQAFGYLPEAENDSIFAVYAEKFGFLGAALLIGIFVGLFARMRRLAEHAPDMFTRLLVVGVLTWFSVQAIINMGAMMGLLPLKGITLPFISYGGTSVLFAMAAIGLLFQISRYTSQRVTSLRNEQGDITDDDCYDRRRIRGAYHPGARGR